MAFVYVAELGLVSRRFTENDLRNVVLPSVVSDAPGSEAMNALQALWEYMEAAEGDNPDSPRKGRRRKHSALETFLSASPSSVKLEFGVLLKELWGAFDSTAMVLSDQSCERWMAEIDRCLGSEESLQQQDSDFGGEDDDILSEATQEDDDDDTMMLTQYTGAVDTATCLDAQGLNEEPTTSFIRPTFACVRRWTRMFHRTYRAFSDYSSRLDSKEVGKDLSSLHGMVSAVTDPGWISEHQVQRLHSIVAEDLPFDEQKSLSWKVAFCRADALVSALLVCCEPMFSTAARTDLERALGSMATTIKSILRCAVADQSAMHGRTHEGAQRFLYRYYPYMQESFSARLKYLDTLVRRSGLQIAGHDLSTSSMSPEDAQRLGVRRSSRIPKLRGKRALGSHDGVMLLTVDFRDVDVFVHREVLDAYFRALDEVDP